MLVAGTQLGFKVNTYRDAIYARALKRGLQRCPAEVGPALREQYTDQQMNDWVLIGMDPMIASDGRLGVFGVGRNVDGLWLIGSNNLDLLWHPDVRWVFVLPRNS